MILKDIAERIGMDISTVSAWPTASTFNALRHAVAEVVLLRRVDHRQRGRGEFPEVKKILQDAIAEEDKRKPLPTRSSGCCSTPRGTTSRAAPSPSTGSNSAFLWHVCERNCDEDVGEVGECGASSAVHAAVDPGDVASEDGYLKHRIGLSYFLFVLLLINTLAPAVSLWMLQRRGFISDLDIRSRKERPWPFLLVLAYYTMAYLLVLNSTAWRCCRFTARCSCPWCVDRHCVAHHPATESEHAHDGKRGTLAVYTHVPFKMACGAWGGSPPWCCLQDWWVEQAHLGGAHAL